MIDIGPNMKLILARMLGVMYINEALYFAVLSDGCIVDIYTASQYFHYFDKIVFSTNLRRPSYELLLEK